MFGESRGEAKFFSEVLYECGVLKRHAYCTSFNLTMVNTHFNNWFVNISSDSYYAVAYTLMGALTLNSWDAAKFLLDKFSLRQTRFGLEEFTTHL